MRFQWFFPKPDLYLDPRRINDEVRAERRRELDEDPAYRARVKRRMLLGLTAAELPPLIDRDRSKHRGGLVVFRGSWGA